jgi:hypothetical protein
MSPILQKLLEHDIEFILSFIFLAILCAGVFLGVRWVLYKIKEKEASSLAVIQMQPQRMSVFPTQMPCQDCSFNNWRDPQDLLKHSIFGYIRLCRAVSIPNLPVTDPGRKMVSEDLLDLKFRIVSESILEWLKNHSSHLSTMGGEELCSELLSLLASIFERYEQEGEAIGIPAEVLECFRHWQSKRVLYLQGEISLVTDSEWIHDPVHRVGFALSAFEYVLRATLLDAEATLTSLNGALTGKTYRGVILGPPSRH